MTVHQLIFVRTCSLTVENHGENEMNTPAIQNNEANEKRNHLQQQLLCESNYNANTHTHTHQVYFM